MISDLMEDSLKIRDTGKKRSDKAYGADTCVINLLHGLQPSLDADGIVHIIFKAFVQCIDRPRDRDLSQFFQKVDVTDYQIRLGTDENFCLTALELFKKLSGVLKLSLLGQISIGH